MAAEPVFLKIGHRGCAGCRLENSLAAFREALNSGLEFVELDVQITADGVPVVFHDRRLDRVTNATGVLREKGYGWLNANVRLLNGEPIPTLEDVLAVLAPAPTGLYVELIDPDAAPIAQQTVSRALPAERVIFSSFHHQAVRRVKDRAPAQRTMALFKCAPIDPVGLVQAAGADQAGIDLRGLSEASVRPLQDAGYPVFAHTVNHPEDMDYARSLGLHGVFTDYP